MVLYCQPVCRFVAAATALALAATGCGYQSTYVAPQDGRARVIWGAGDVPMVDMSGATVSSECNVELNHLGERPLPGPSHVELNVQPQSYYVSSGSGYWAPRYYGPPIIVVRPGLAPAPPRFPLYMPRVAVPAPIGGHPIIVRPPSVSPSIGRSGGSISSLGRTGGGSISRGGGGGGGGGSFGKEAGAIVIILAVITATVLPVVALGLAASMPESNGKTASAIDMVNAYNDLARIEGTPCTPIYSEPAGFPLPQEQPQ